MLKIVNYFPVSVFDLSLLTITLFSHDILSINTNGLRNIAHRNRLFNQIKSKAAILAFQETHSCLKDENHWPNSLGGGTMIFNHGSLNARGVAIFISKRVDCQIQYTYRDSDGRVLIVVLELNGIKLCLANIYAPNLSFCSNDKATHEQFLVNLKNQLDLIKTQQQFSELILLGDFNMILDRQLDAIGGNPSIYSKSIESLTEIIHTHNLIDIFRELNPDTNLFTYCPGGPNVRGIYRRLDYIFIPDTWLGEVKVTNLIPASHSDHRIIQLVFRKSVNTTKNSGLWKHNDKLNTNEEYLDEFKRLFPSWTEEARVLEDPRSVWEYLKFKIKIHSRNFSIRLAKKKTEFRKSTEERLIKLEALLQNDPLNPEVALKPRLD